VWANIRSPPPQEFDIDRPYAITKNVLIVDINGCVAEAISKARCPQSHTPPVVVGVEKIHWGNNWVARGISACGEDMIEIFQPAFLEAYDLDLEQSMDFCV
jgi:hypothetical protein